MSIRWKGLVPRTWRRIKKLLLILVIAQFVYIVALKWVNPPITPTMVAVWVHTWGTNERFSKTWVSYSSISPYAKLAVMAGEDQLFPDHDGFDIKSIEKAWKHNERSTKIRGASTISQQVAKNVFLWQGRSWIRKGLEVYFTFMIEHIWGKRRILEVYLNVAQMGQSIFGIGAAAHTYYHIPARNLNRDQAAMIAACLPDPLVYRVQPPSGITLWRQRWILTQMGHLQGDPDIENLINEK